MNPVVVDASAAVEIVNSTERGRRLAQLLPSNASLWVPSHFYAEVFAVIRHMTVVSKKITRHRAESAIRRLSEWHLRQVAVAPLMSSAWRFRHNLSGSDSIYVALANQLGASLLTDDLRLANSPAIPRTTTLLMLPVHKGP